MNKLPSSAPLGREALSGDVGHVQVVLASVLVPDADEPAPVRGATSLAAVGSLPVVESHLDIEDPALEPHQHVLKSSAFERDLASSEDLVKRSDDGVGAVLEAADEVAAFPVDAGKELDQPECGTNRSYYINIINFWPNPYKADPARFAHLYLQKGLSAKQIAESLGVAKSTVLDRLHALGIRAESAGQRATNPDSYRAPNPPYGYRVQDGKLLVNKSELRTCRLMVELLGHKNLSANATAKELERRGIGNRKGVVKWGHFTVQTIFNRWKDKL